MISYLKYLAAGAGGTGATAAATWAFLPWIKYDLQQLNMNKKMAQAMEATRGPFFIDVFEQRVEKHPKKTFLIYEDSVYSYEFVDQMACRVASVAKSWGLKQGDTVALMMENEPAFVWIFLGLLKVCVGVAFINHHLRSEPLVHSLAAVDPKFIIVGAAEQGAVADIFDHLHKIPVYVHGLGTNPPLTGFLSYDETLKRALPVAVSTTIRRNLTPLDACFFIYTSGTTGNPKASIINQLKAKTGCHSFSVVDLQFDDVVYTTLPLYHNSGMVALTSVVGHGATMVFRKKFSASHFWSDCVKHNVTIIQYIGELLRYLLASPPSPLERAHKVRAAAGNGLRSDIWTQVQSRFGIKNIVEVYGATEGPSVVVNLANKPGAVGRLSPLLNLLDQFPKALVKFDLASASPLRDNKGRCMKAGIGEPGLFLCKIPQDLIQAGLFKVYTEQKATEEKLVRNVFEDDDVYFNFGDLLVLDKDYFLYFKDRLGDTFRWKGENVSTTEVANQITKLDFVLDANVFGVKIPDTDGRAGMAALTLEEGHTFGAKEQKELYDHVEDSLPSNARPLFVRVLAQSVLTATFKQQKVNLMKDGYNLDAVVGDPLFYRDTKTKTYSPLTRETLSTFVSSKL